MAYWNWTTFTGLSDDSFLGRSGEFYDCNNIDVIDNSGYVDGAKHPNIAEIGSSLWSSITATKDGTYPVFCNTSNTYWWFGGVSSWVADLWQVWAYLVETIGTPSLPVAYWFKNGFIRQQTYNGSWVTNVWVITTNVPTGIPTASCIGAWRIYFAVANTIRVINTTIDPTVTLSTVNATEANKNIPFWYTIKYMYIYMDVMNVVTTDGRNTIIYQLTEDTTDNWSIRYYHRIKWVVAIGACGEGNSLYWFSNNAIYQSNGVESQKVKVNGKDELGTTFSDTAFCTISEGIFKIADGATLWEYWHKKPWYNPVLVKKTRVYPITAMDSRLEVSYKSTGTKVYGARDNDFLATPLLDYSITSLPYSAQDLLSKKEGTYLRVGHFLPAYSTYTDTSQLCSFNIKILTDEMEQKGITSGVQVATITTPTTWVSERFTDIDTSEIITALSNAWYNPDFNYTKLIVEWIRWDLWGTFATYWIALWKKSPKFFGIRLSHNEILKWG